MFTRRQWLQRAAAASATAALGCPSGGAEPEAPRAMPGPKPAPAPAPPPTAPDLPPLPKHEHALATYEVLHDSAILWVFHARAKSARLELQGAPNGKRTVALPETTGHTAAHAIGALAHNTEVRYRWHFDDATASDWHTFRTLPDPSAAAPVHFVFGADIISMEKYRSNITDRMVSTGAQGFLSLGDWPYCDLPRPAAKSLAEFRECHRKSRRIPQLHRLLKTMPVYGIFDDHEVKNDWGPAFVRDHPERAHAGIQAWNEFFPLRSKTKYRSWRWGSLAEIFMLDLRTYRSPYKDAPGPEKTMLGAAQKKWLLAGLQNSTAAFQIVCSSVPLGFGTTREHWNAYPTERKELIAALTRRPGRCIVLTADQHWFAAHHHQSGIREYQVGPIMAFTREPGPRVPEVVARSVQPNFGEISIVPGSPARLMFICHDRYGRAIYAETLRAT